VIVRAIERAIERAADDHAIRQVFRSTLALGRPVPFPLPGLARYEAICLDWYLGPGRDDVAVVEQDGTVVGYALVCTDGGGHTRGTRDAAIRFAAWAAPRIAARRLPDPARTFWRLRLVDGWAAWRRSRHTSASPPAAHAHLNLVRGARATRATLQLLAHIDDRVRAAGLTSWQGEVNAVRGRRRSALERVVGPVVDETPNHTYTLLAGRPVDRLTVERQVPPGGSPDDTKNTTSRTNTTDTRAPAG
jgi:hypothetical protein